MDSVKFLTKFETFTNPIVPYMYHCHLLHHEDDGMMGSFIVIDSSALGVSDLGNIDHATFQIYPNPATSNLIIESKNTSQIISVSVTDMAGRQVYRTTIPGTHYLIDISKWSRGVYAISIINKDGITTRKLVVE
jgi:bilirubin oxidase